MAEKTLGVKWDDSEALEPIAHVIVQYGNKGILCLTQSQYDQHVARNRKATSPPDPKPQGIISRTCMGVRT